MHPYHLEDLVNDRLTELQRTRQHSRTTANPAFPGRRRRPRVAGLRPIGLLLIRVGDRIAGSEVCSPTTNPHRVQ
jgi:hypothetical protein